MKKEIQESRDKLIQHLEHKIQALKQERTQLNKKTVIPTIGRSIEPNIIIDDYRRPADVIEQNKMNLANLEKLYQQKKNLQKMGITNVPKNKISYYAEQPFIKQRVNKQAKLDPEKKKIVDEEMKKIEKKIKGSKTNWNKKEQQAIKSLEIGELLKDDSNTFNKYQTLIKGKLGLVQKQQLLSMVFDILKVYPQTIEKSKLSLFLRANVDFSSKFYITENQIYNDLVVYKTNQQQKLTFQQFYEFIKSIQLTAPNLNPKIVRQVKQTTNKKVKIDNISKSKSVCIKEQQNYTTIQKNIEKYLIKLFQYFDNKNQGVINRKTLLGALQRKFLLKSDKPKKASQKDNSDEKYTFQSNIIIDGKVLQKVIEKITQRQVAKSKESYYAQLQSHYIGCEQMLDDLKYVIRKLKSSTETPPDQSKQISVISEEKDTINNSQLNYSSQLNQNISQKSEDIPYPWQRNQAQRQKQLTPLEQLKHLDSYYQDVYHRNGAEIEWGKLKNNQVHFETAQKEILEQFQNLTKQFKNIQARSLNKK